MKGILTTTRFGAAGLSPRRVFDPTRRAPALPTWCAPCPGLRGFTLIELTIVLLIMAIVAAAVTLRLHTPLRHAELRDVAGAVAQYDRTTRLAAREQDRPLRMVVGLSSRRISRTDERGRATGAPLALPGRVAIEQLIVRTQTAHEGEVGISCSRLGFTPTYAMRLGAGGMHRWIVVVGLTGEAVEVDNEDQARQILEAAGRGNAG